MYFPLILSPTVLSVKGSLYFLLCIVVYPNDRVEHVNAEGKSFSFATYM